MSMSVYSVAFVTALALTVSPRPVPSRLTPAARTASLVRAPAARSASPSPASAAVVWRGSSSDEPAAAAAPPKLRRKHAPPNREHLRTHLSASGIPAGELYSLRARRRFAGYLRMRLLEMREAGLERAAKVIEHRLPVNALVGR